MSKGKIAKMLEEKYPWVDVWTPDGTKKYQFTLLDVATGQDVYHDVLISLSATLVGAIGETGNRIDAIRSLDKKTKNYLMTTLLSGCVVRPNPAKPELMEPIDDPRTHEYFRDKNEEIYCAIWFALKANFPNSFRRFEKIVSDITPKIEAAMKRKFSILSDTEPLQS